MASSLDIWSVLIIVTLAQGLFVISSFILKKEHHSISGRWMLLLLEKDCSGCNWSFYLFVGPSILALISFTAPGTDHGSWLDQHFTATLKHCSVRISFEAIICILLPFFFSRYYSRSYLRISSRFDRFITECSPLLTADWTRSMRFNISIPLCLLDSFSIWFSLSGRESF